MQMVPPPGVDRVRAARIAGWSLLLMAALAAFANFGVLEQLIVADDAVATAANIGRSELLFRFGIAVLIVVVILDIIVAFVLYTVFEPAGRQLSAVAAGFRIAYAAVFLVAIGNLTDTGEPGHQGKHSIDSFTTAWHAGLILFGVHLLLLGCLAFRAGFIPKAFGVLLIIAGLGYLLDGFGQILVADYSLNIAQFTFIGEVTLIFWLLTGGSRVDVKRSEAAAI